MCRINFSANLPCNPPCVLYSHDIFSNQFVGGISRYIFELYIRNNNAKIPLIYTENLYIHRCSKKPYFKGKNRIIYFINECAERYRLKFNTFDIYHISYYKYFDKPKNTATIVTVHDMIHEIYANSYFKHDTTTCKIKAHNCKKADGIIAISHQTKNDIIKFLNIPADKIQVIYHGHSLQKKITQLKITLPKSYVLFVGSRWGYKNFDTFAKAMAILNHQYPHIKAICVGSAFNKDEKALFQSLGISSLFLHYQANDDELYTLYANALCFVFPSLYEGFGIPILEAFFSNCPVILSDIAVFREIAQDAALYFAPQNSVELFAQIHKLISKNALKYSLINLANERLAHFSWDKTYAETLAFYTQIYKQLGEKRGGLINKEQK